jgi:hypothetical protein
MGLRRLMMSLNEGRADGSYPQQSDRARVRSERVVCVCVCVCGARDVVPMATWANSGGQSAGMSFSSWLTLRPNASCGFRWRWSEILARVMSSHSTMP